MTQEGSSVQTVAPATLAAGYGGARRDSALSQHLHGRTRSEVFLGWSSWNVAVDQSEQLGALCFGAHLAAEDEPTPTDAAADSPAQWVGPPTHARADGVSLAQLRPRLFSWLQSFGPGALLGLLLVRAPFARASRRGKGVLF